MVQREEHKAQPNQMWDKGREEEPNPRIYGPVKRGEKLRRNIMERKISVDLPTWEEGWPLRQAIEIVVGEWIKGIRIQLRGQKCTILGFRCQFFLAQTL